MSGPVRIDPGLILSIAQKCRTSSDTLNGEASTMKAQLESLQEALQGFPRLAMADQFQQLNGTFTTLSGQLQQANDYLQKVEGAVQEFIARMGQG